MVGRTIESASIRAAIQNVLSSLRRSIGGRNRLTMRASEARRAIAAVLLAAVMFGSASYPALGGGKGATPATGPTTATGATPATAAGALTPEMVNKAEQRLSEIGYWAGATKDKTAERTRYVVLAFQRVEGRSQTGKLDAADIEALSTAARPAPRETGYAHIEVDLSRQVLFVVDQNSAVTMVLPISSGSGKLYTFEGKTSRAVTPRGRFTVYRKVNGWRKAPLGMIYYPNYFNEGWAIHGSTSVPNYPASHGCIRIPIATAKELSDITPVGTVVLIYNGSHAVAPDEHP